MRYIHGLVSLFQQGDTGFRRTRYTAVVEPTLARFRLRSNWRIFQSQTVPDIITSMLAEQELTDTRTEICFEHQPREYCVQAGEADLDFIARLAAEEGLLCTFEHRADDHTLVLTDRVGGLGMSNENRERYCFEWDVLDRLMVQQDLDGSGRIYQYNPLGDVTGIHHIPAPNAELDLDGKDSAEPHMPLVHHFERDSLGRLIRKRTDDGVTEYAYDNADNLLEISFTDNQGDRQQLDYTYDTLGQLLSETNSAGELKYAYDALGNLETLTLPDQSQLNHLYYGSGHLHQLNLNGRVISDFERDALHKEVLRTQGALHTRTRYDRNGRLSQKALHYQQVAREVLPLLQKDYQYDASDNLVAEILTQTQRPGGSRPTAAANDDSLIGRFHHQATTGKSYKGSAQYGYSPVEQIQSMHRSNPGVQGQYIESLNYDPAGNLFDGYRVNGLIKHNRVHVYQDKRYRYDRFGRLSEKRSGSSRIQRFEYDAEHRLIEVHQQNGALRQRVVFGYDPLGRRISKQVYHDNASEPSNRTLFHWQGLRLLEEVQDGRPSLYVYADPGSYEPLARLDGKPGSEAIFYFHTNLAGLPEQLTDTAGNTVWHSEYQAWGKSRDEWHDQQPGREQNLRFQGQYLDRETGLHYNTFRFFDPDVGRFTQPDPIGLAGGLNLYQYAPNAIGWIDPWGLNSLLPGEGITGTFGKLPGTPGDNLTGHHMPSAAYMKQNFGIPPQRIYRHADGA